MADDLDHLDEAGEWSTVWGPDDVEDSDDTWPDDVRFEPVHTGGLHRKALLAVRIDNKDGVLWYEAPLPRRWHRCRVQTAGVVDERCVERCACGAIRVDRDGWLERNSRRRDQATQATETKPH